MADAPLSRSPLAWGLLAVVGVALFAGFVALGTWQVHRRAWKLELIDRVEHRLQASPVAPPGRSQWPAVSKADEYLKVRLHGVFIADKAVRVQAVTERGPGFWLLQPLVADAGFTVLVNRGFIEADTQPAPAPDTAVDVTGLLRVSEPGGAFLRHNDPSTNRWYSRDVTAIAAALRLPAADVAPYFIDADAATSPGSGSDGQPVGGLTVIHFHNSHLVYAITWYTLALMVVGAAVIILRQERRREHGGG
jgi:surfeit locus 1 family protein